MLRVIAELKLKRSLKVVLCCQGKYCAALEHLSDFITCIISYQRILAPQTGHGIFKFIKTTSGAPKYSVRNYKGTCKAK